MSPAVGGLGRDCLRRSHTVAALSSEACLLTTKCAYWCTPKRKSVVDSRRTRLDGHQQSSTRTCTAHRSAKQRGYQNFAHTRTPSKWFWLQVSEATHRAGQGFPPAGPVYKWAVTRQFLPDGRVTVRQGDSAVIGQHESIAVGTWRRAAPRGAARLQDPNDGLGPTSRSKSGCHP